MSPTDPQEIHPALKPGYEGKLKDGTPYRCYATDGGQDHPIHGAFFEKHFLGWHPISHHADGRWLADGSHPGANIDLPPIEAKDTCQHQWENRRWYNGVGVVDVKVYCSRCGASPIHRNQPLPASLPAVQKGAVK